MPEKVGKGRHFGRSEVVEEEAAVLGSSLEIMRKVDRRVGNKQRTNK